MRRNINIYHSIFISDTFSTREVIIFWNRKSLYRTTHILNIQFSPVMNRQLIVDDT